MAEAATDAAEVDAIGGGPEDPIADVAAIAVGLGTLLGIDFGLHKKEKPPPPVEFADQLGA